MQDILLEPEYSDEQVMRLRKEVITKRGIHAGQLHNAGVRLPRCSKSVFLFYFKACLIG
jgi:hypothetical protein